MIRAHIVALCQSCVVSALLGNRGRFWVIRHFDIKDERNLASHFGGLTQESECASLESAALQTETLPRVHLPEKSNLPILLRKHPNSEQIATRHERLIKIVARFPCALCSRILRHGSIHCACILFASAAPSIPALIDSLMKADCPPVTVIQRPCRGLVFGTLPGSGVPAGHGNGPHGSVLVLSP